jgi:inorganic pyrophosphatase
MAQLVNLKMKFRIAHRSDARARLNGGCRCRSMIKPFHLWHASTFQPVGGQMGKNKGLADPSRLDPLVPKDKQLLRVVIETPKGSRNKFAFNSNDHAFELKKVLPAGMAFPYDFGFVPCTKAEDGDPIDVLVLMDEPAFPGCMLKCRPIGVIEGEQVSKGNKRKKERNDRIIAVEKDAHSWADITTVGDLGEEFRRELEEFFVNYHKLSREEYKVLAVKGPDRAHKLVKSGMR